MINFRTYFRNKAMLKDMGLTYSWKQHQKYTYTLLANDIDPVSVPGAIQKEGLNKPVRKKDCETYSTAVNKNPIHEKLKPEIAQARRASTYHAADKYNKEHSKLPQDCLMYLSHAITAPLMMQHEKNVHEVTVNRNTSDNSETKGFVCDQSWKISTSRSLAYALVA